MKGYMIPFGARSLVSTNKKIDLQAKQLSRISDLGETDVAVDLSSKWKTLISILFRGSLPIDYTQTYAEIVDPDYLFIRHAGADRQFVKFLCRIKRRYPRCVIVVEIPTYPYMREKLASIANWLLLPSEMYNRHKLKHYIDLFFVYYNIDRIFGVRTIVSMNGIEVSSIKPIETELSSTINLIAVAYMQAYHGYERIIKGLSDYYGNGGKREVDLYLVGEGPELESYRRLVESEHIAEHVHFCGKLVGDSLNEVFQKASIAVEALGYYKIGLSVSTTLKVREYLAYGLPVVSGNQIDVFNKYPFPYFLEFSNDKSTVDINEIVSFYDRVYKERNRTKVANEIHQYALAHVDISQTMKPLLDYIQTAAGAGSDT